MNLIDLEDLLGIHTARMSDSRSGPCEDDCEVTAPWIGRCPEESNHEDGSPLNFRQDHSDPKTMHERASAVLRNKRER